MASTLSLLMMIQEAFVGNVDQDQTTKNVQSNLRSTLSTFSILDYNQIVSSSSNGTIKVSGFIIQISKKDTLLYFNYPSPNFDLHYD